jgi:hypothetical protein
MKRNRGRVVLFAAIGLAVLLAVGIAVIYLLYGEPDTGRTRPANVPASARWYGGQDGGNWIDCFAASDSANHFACTIYDDYQGSLIYKGMFALKGAHTAVSELKDLLAFYDGESIHLKDRRRMVPEGIPSKPSNVPPTAIWDTEKNWIDCELVKDSINQFHCTVYFFTDGDVVCDGVFTLEGKSTSLDELKRLVGSYTGTYILLKDGRRMIAKSERHQEQR